MHADCKEKSISNDKEKLVKQKNEVEDYNKFKSGTKRSDTKNERMGFSFSICFNFCSFIFEWGYGYGFINNVQKHLSFTAVLF